MIKLIGKQFSTEWEATPPEMTRLECDWLWRTDFDKTTATEVTENKIREAISFSIGSKPSEIVKDEPAVPTPPKAKTPPAPGVVLPVLNSPPPYTTNRVPPELPVSPGM